MEPCRGRTHDLQPDSGYGKFLGKTGITFNSPHDFATSRNALFITEVGGRVWLILAATALPGRKITVERSTNLTLWGTWNVTGIPRNSGTPFSLTAPASSPKEFFRYRVSEN